MKTRQFYSILAAMAAATVCILVLQGYIWQQSIEQEEQRFDESVERAVNRMSVELMSTYTGSRVLVDVMDRMKNGDQSQAPKLSDKTTQFLKGRIAGSEIHTFEQESDFTSFSITSDSAIADFTVKIESECPSCLATADKPVLDRIRPILTERLAIDGIEDRFDFGVIDIKTGEWIKNPTNALALENSPRSFKFVSLLHPKTSAGNAELRLYFPNERMHVLRRLATSLVLSGLLALGVLACLGYSLRTIMRQKQLSEIKTDFINNMTHELKTPIATISLASEALSDTEVEFASEKREEYIGMISSEADRLRDQVEKVLQMSLIDKGDLGLKMEPINIHSLIQDCVSGFKLKIQQREGDLKLGLHSQRELVKGDPMHVRQMLSNLLDNAEKYSPNYPHLKIETTALEEGVEIAVSDKGVGIGRDKMKRIFDRFYRIPSGNLHDVKGFGLGLSYVMSMAEAHGGSVSASSKPGHGSTFYLTLPYADA